MHADQSKTASLPQLLQKLQIIDRCRFVGAEAQLLDAAAGELLDAAAATLLAVDMLCIPAGMKPAALARLGSSTLAQLLYRVSLNSGSDVRQSLRIRDVRQAGMGTPGGFTLAIHDFSSSQTSICSPWVGQLGGFEWRLIVFPQGILVGAGTHLGGESFDGPGIEGNGINLERWYVAPLATDLACLLPLPLQPTWSGAP